MLRTINPSTGECIKEYSCIKKNEIDQIIENTHEAFLHWSKTSYQERSEKMRAASALLLKNKRWYAELMAQEMGKPITQGQAEVEKCRLVCEYYAEHTEHLLQPKVVETDCSKSYTLYQPTGIIFAIMPWNFPLWQVFRFAAPNLMAGNVALLKHAEIVTGTGLEIEKLLQSAGFPNGVFRTLLIDNDQAETVIAHPHISGVTLTGSHRAGSAVGAASGKNIKKSVLELGGNDPYIVLEDADLDLVTEICIDSRLKNSGQVCIAAKRIIVVNDVYDALLPRFMKKIQEYQMGHPLEKNTQIGPLARKDLRATVHDQVQRTVKTGAALILGGNLPENPGFYYPPTLLSNVKPGSPAFDEEIFGPVIAMIRAKSTEEAIQLANQTEYGLGAAVFTKNIKRGEEIAAHRIQAASCAVNTFVRSDPRLPFGGIKNSGYGRELAFEGLTAFLNIKTILIQ